MEGYAIQSINASAGMAAAGIIMLAGLA